MPCPLSVVVPSHNRPDLLRACLASVTRHCPPGTQWLVVDDASPAGAVSEVARSFPGVELLRRDVRGGFCAAVNVGLQATRGEVVQVLNDDAEVTAGYAGPALRRFSDRRVVAVTPLVLKAGPIREGEAPAEPHAPGSAGASPSQPGQIDSTGDVYYPAGFARKRGHGEPLTPRHLRPGPVFGASGSASFYRREALLACGGFAEELRAYFDDVDLSFRLNRLGVVWYEPASVVHHRVSSSYGPPSGDLLALQSRNEELVFWRNLSALQLFLWLPAHVTAVGLKALRRWREGQLMPFVRGRLAALASAGDVIRYRARWTALGATPSGR
jgi:GT2 family glycosyltransferase